MASQQYPPPSAPQPNYPMGYNQYPSQPPPQPFPQMGYPMASYPPQPPPQPSPPAVTSIHVGGGSPSGFIPGSCPVCHGTSWTGSYSCCAWLLCIIFFPVGLICCCCMRKKKCTKCGFKLG